MREDQGCTIRLRPATYDDSAFLLSLRNDPEARARSLNPNIVTEVEHSKWLQNCLVSYDRKVFIADHGNETTSIGCVRGSQLNSLLWELSWAIAPQYRGMGFGKQLLIAGIKKFNQHMCARILRNNLPSKHIASATGFSKLRSYGEVELWFYPSPSMPASSGLFDLGDGHKYEFRKDSDGDCWNVFRQPRSLTVELTK